MAARLIFESKMSQTRQGRRRPELLHTIKPRLPMTHQNAEATYRARLIFESREAL